MALVARQDTRPIFEYLHPHQARMKAAPTSAEAVMMARLIEADLHVLHQCIIGGFIVDLVVPQKMAVLELDGVQHLSEEARAYDWRRSRFLAAHGFKVFRIPNAEAETWNVLAVERLPDIPSGTWDRLVADKLIDAGRPAPVWHPTAEDAKHRRLSQTTPTEAREAKRLARRARRYAKWQARKAEKRRIRLLAARKEEPCEPC